MTTTEIIDILFDKKRELYRTPGGYKCYFNLYKCSLKNDDVHNLFDFQFEKTFSAFHPKILINIPEGEIIDVFKHDEKYNYKELNYLLKMFSEDIIKEYGKELTYIVFCILHEVGHWVYMCNNDYSPQEYEEKDFNERKMFYENNVEITSEESFQKYREITSEKEADKYAIEKLQGALEAIVNSRSIMKFIYG